MRRKVADGRGQSRVRSDSRYMDGSRHREPCASGDRRTQRDIGGQDPHVSSDGAGVVTGMRVAKRVRAAERMVLWRRHVLQGFYPWPCICVALALGALYLFARTSRVFM